MRRILTGLASLLVSTLVSTVATPVSAQTFGPGDDLVVQARDAWRKRDMSRLVTIRNQLVSSGHPLAVWVDYWELNGRLNIAQPDEVQAFFARYPGSYLEDRLRNDWLLELGKRFDWKNFQYEYARFRMNDDREVSCYSALAEHLDGKDVRDRAFAAWVAQRESDAGCNLLASTMVEAKKFSNADLWSKTRNAVEANRKGSASQAAMLISPKAATGINELLNNPAIYVTRKASTATRTDSELAAMAIARMGVNDPDAAAELMAGRWEKRLPKDLAAWTWNSIGKQAALKLSPDASTYFQHGDIASGDSNELVMPEESLQWKARAALRGNSGNGRWQQLVQAVNAMRPDEQADPTWIYWKARALQGLAKESQDPEGMRAQATELLMGIAGQLNFYGKLASEELGRTVPIPLAPAALTSQERDAAANNASLARSLRMIAIGLRGEGVREWNFSLRDLPEDRQLLAAAQLACEREVWDRCINTSDRTRTEIDLQQRFPMPYKRDVTTRAREIGLDPAYVYGLIRQESRFIMDARSGVGASGLMQLMPATASWVAKKIGEPYGHGMIADRTMNIKLGTSYLKLVLDDFEGSQAMAAAAYNAGPGRPRRWRDGPVMETAAWAENIPFAETRDYVKKVLSNATYYSALLTSEPQSLKARLGKSIGPRVTPPPAFEKEMP
ncbi:lytic transglycosylase domain-containing protein [soil metagenome]